MRKWLRRPLCELAEFERELIQPDEIPPGTIYVGLEHITSNGTLVGARPIESHTLASTKFRFSNRHILYGKLRPYLAKIACPEFSGVCSTDILPILPGPEIDRRFLFHYLRWPKIVRYAASKAVGANLPRLSTSVLGSVQIPVPPLDEQRLIAEVLDRAEMLVIKRAAALQQLNTLGQAVFMRLFGEAISASQLPVSLLGEVAEVVSGVTKGRQLRGPSVVEVPYLRVANVQAGFLDLSEVKTIPALPEEVEELRLLPGDVLMTEGGDYDKLGRGAIWDGQIANCIHQNHVFRVRVDRNRLDPKYFTYFLQTPFARRYFLRCAKRTTNLASINMTQLKALPVPLPPVALQREFVRRVEAVEQQIAQYRVSLAQLESLYASLQHRAFRGEL